MALQNTMGRIMLISCSVFLIPFILLALYIFPVQAKFENKIFNNIKNALLMSIRHFFYSLLLLMIYATIVLLLFSAIYGVIPMLRNWTYSIFNLKYFHLYLQKICTRGIRTGFGSFRKNLLLTHRNGACHDMHDCPIFFAIQQNFRCTL